MPKAQLGQGAGPAVGEALRSILMQYLSGPSVEIIPIAALLPQQIEAEGAAKHCDYLAYTSFVVKRSSGGMGFLKGASTFAGMIPMAGGGGSMGGAVAGTAAIALAEEAAAMSSGITAKSQVVMDYHLSVPGSNTPVLSKSLNAKATSDGEDIITPLIEQEATAILAEVTTKK